MSIEHFNSLNHGFEHALSRALMRSQCALSVLSVRSQCALMRSHALSCALVRARWLRSCALMRSHALSVFSFIMRAHALSCALMCSRVLSVISRMRAHVLSCAEAGVVAMCSCIGNLPVLIGTGDNPVGLQKEWCNHQYSEYAGLRSCGH